MVQFALRRLVLMVPVILGITLIVFLIVGVLGDPVTLLLPADARQSEIDALRRSLGLDRPLPERFIRFLGDVVRGDFGDSIRYSGQPALPIVLERIPATLELTIAALLVSIAISLPLGILAAIRRGTWVDNLATSFAVLGQSTPNFWIGLLLILVFSVQLRWLPVSGRGTLAHLVLPAITLGTGLAAVLMRLLRSSLLEVMNLDYVRTARAKGLAPHLVLVRHALRNALLSYVTVLSLQMSRLLAGAVVTEQVFAWPGTGLLLIQAIYGLDMSVVQGVVVMSAVIVMVGNLIVDLVYAALDPRIRYA